MSRLASLSTPTRRQSPSPSPSPAPTDLGVGVVETTHHRMLKLVITEFKSLFRTWDDLVGVDGLKAGQGIINAQTTMDNIITIEEGPEREFVGPHLLTLAEQKDAFTAVMTKLERLLGKLSLLIDQSEKIYFEAHSKQSQEFLDEPLWYTWTILHFINSLPPLLHQHVLHLTLLIDLHRTITSPQTTFEDSKLALERWLALSRGGERWEAIREWEELVDLEMIGYGNGLTVESDSEEDLRPSIKKKGKGKK